MVLVIVQVSKQKKGLGKLLLRPTVDVFIEGIVHATVPNMKPTTTKKIRRGTRGA